MTENEDNGKPDDSGNKDDPSDDGNKGNNTQNGRIQQNDPNKNDGKFSVLDEAKKTIQELKDLNLKMADNMKKAEEMAISNMMGGRSSAGSEPTKEDRIIGKAKEMLKGTGYDTELFPK